MRPETHDPNVTHCETSGHASECRDTVTVQSVTGYTNGQGGIRTHERLHVTRFPGVRLQPLGHLS